MSTALDTIGTDYGFEPTKLQLIKDTIAKGTSTDELNLFLYTCQRTGLDPLARQIYCIKRWDSTLRREVATPQTSIDGYRLIADRTGNYAPGKAPTYEENEGGGVFAATAYVMKYVRGTWHEVSATAYWEEYAQSKKDGTYTHMWATKPRVMLGKCAEALALRRAFPAELSGLYTESEMPEGELVSLPAATPEPLRLVNPPTPRVLTADPGRRDKIAERLRAVMDEAESLLPALSADNRATLQADINQALEIRIDPKSTIDQLSNVGLALATSVKGHREELEAEDERGSFTEDAELNPAGRPA